MSEQYQIRGFLHSKTAPITIQTKSNKDFTKMEFILNTIEQKGQFTNEAFITFEASGDKISQLDTLIKGNEIEVTFFINGNLYTDKQTGVEKSFTSLKAVKVELYGVGNSVPINDVVVENGEVFPALDSDGNYELTTTIVTPNSDLPW